jgi:hypothetical protein
LTLSKSFSKLVTWALSSLISSTRLVVLQVLEEVHSSLLEQQGKSIYSSQDVGMLCLDELLRLAHGNIKILVGVVLMSTWASQHVTLVIITSWDNFISS